METIATLTDLIEILRDKSNSIPDGLKENRARKDAYVDCITLMRERVQKVSKEASNCNKPAVSKCEDVEREALLRDYTDWLWINHNILTNVDNNEVALKQYLSRNSC
jgi:hypothetical protein